MPQLALKGCRLHYEVHGKTGPAIVFAHGRGGCAASWWQQVPAFRHDHRVIVYDSRGFARSVCEADGAHLDHAVDDLAAILDAEGIDRAVLVGQSMGGRPVFGLAVRQPQRVRGVVLSCTAGGLTIPAVIETQGMRQNIPRGIEAPTAALAPSFRDANPAMTFLYEQLRGMSPPQGPLFKASLGGLDGGVAPEELPGYAVPTLVISAEHDVLYPPALLEQVAAAIPGARLKHVPGSGHSPYWERPETFNAMLRDFMASLPA